jgi:hypothetical protein
MHKNERYGRTNTKNCYFISVNVLPLFPAISENSLIEEAKITFIYFSSFFFEQAKMTFIYNNNNES